MAERLHRCQDDDGTAGPAHAPLRHHRDRQRELALQEPRLIGRDLPRACRRARRRQGAAWKRWRMLDALSRRPTLTASARAGGARRKVGTKERPPDRTKELTCAAAPATDPATPRAAPSLPSRSRNSSAPENLTNTGFNS